MFAVMSATGIPTMAPIRYPRFGQTRSRSQRSTSPKTTMVATTPLARNIRMAIACSAVLAVSATLTPMRLSTSIIRSMPNVTTGPGRMRAIQSNTSNGGKDRLTHLSTMYMMAIIGATSRIPVSAPIPRFRDFISSSLPFYTKLL